MMKKGQKKYPYRITISFRKEQGNYLEGLVRQGEFQNISHAVRVAVDRLEPAFPVEEQK